MSQESNSSLSLSLPPESPEVSEVHVDGEESNVSEFAEPITGKRFQIRLKRIFITAPKNEKDPKEILDKLIALFKTYDIKYVIVVKETHLDGDWHLHAMVCVSKQPKVINTKIDYIFGKHVNIQKVKLEKNAVRYLFKENLPVFYPPNFNLQDYQSKKGPGVFERVAKRLRDEDDYDILEEDPGFLLQNGAKVASYNKIVSEHKNKKAKIPKRPVKVEILKTWQQQAVKVLLQQNERQILWVVDETGNSGKSWLCDYLDSNYCAFVWGTGKKSDIAFAYSFQPIVAFNFVRSNEDNVSYDIIEQMKDGRIQSTKYESVVKKRKDVKVICFSNFQPDRKKLSQDRWVIMEIGPTGGFSIYDSLEEPLALDDLYASEDDGDSLPEIYR